MFFHSSLFSVIISMYIVQVADELLCFHFLSLFLKFWL